MESEFARLQRLYAELGEEHLKDLSDDMGELTDEAQLALVEEMRRRGLSVPAQGNSRDNALADRPDSRDDRAGEVEVEHSYGFGVGIPGIVPGGEPAMEHALEPGGATRLGMTALTSFSDGLELSHACQVLAEAKIEPAIEEIAGDETAGTSPRYEVWVSAGEAERSRHLLHARMGLFPKAETEASPESHDQEADELVVAQFESAAEAEEASLQLRNGGFRPRIESHAADDAGNAQIEPMLAVLVPASEYEHALNLLTATMGLE